MSIIIDDLRDSGLHPICEQAADEIEALEALVESLRIQRDQSYNDPRIKACLDACENIPTYQLFDVDGKPNDLGEMIDFLRCEVDNKCLQLKSLQLTELQVADIASRHGTINDFGKTFFTDSELYDFVHEFLQTNSQRAMNVVIAVPMENGDGQA